MIKLFYTFSVRHILKKPTRWLLTFLSIVLGVSLFVSISLINDAVLIVFTENINAMTGKAQIAISSGERGIAENILRIVEDTPGVYSAAPVIETKVSFKNPGQKDTTLMIMAVDLLRDSNFRDYDPENPEVIDDPLEFFNQEDSIVITRDFAQKNNLKMDDSFELISVNGPKKFTVRGLLKPTGAAKAYGGSLALMDITGAQFTFGKQGLIDRIDVIVEENADIDEIMGNIRTRIDPSFVVERSSARNAQTENMIRSFQKFLTMVSSIAWWIGLFFIFNSIYISVAQRRTEIGILRGIGADRSTILKIFILEAFSMGFLGSLLGLFLGEYAGVYLVDDVTKTLSVQFQTNMQSPYIELTQNTFLKTLIISTFATFIAALWPSFQATLVHPIEAIKAKSVDLEITLTQKTFFILDIFLLMLFVVLSFLMIYTNPRDDAPIAISIIFIGFLIFCGTVYRLTPLLLHFFETFFKKKDWATGQLAIQNIRRSQGTLYANMGALFLSLLFFAFFASTSGSVKYTVLRYMRYTQYYDLVVTPAGDMTNYQNQPFKPEILKELKSLVQNHFSEDIHYAYNRTLLVKYKEKNIRIHALSDIGDYSNPEQLFLIKKDNPPEALELFFKSEKPYVFISEAFVRNFKLKKGDHFPIQTPTGSYEVEILGVVEDMTSMDGAIFMTLENYRKTWKDDLISYINIKSTHTVDQTKLQNLIETQITGPNGLVLVKQSDFAKEVDKSIDQSFAFTHPIKISALFVGLLTLLSTFSVRILSRLKELGVLRAVGMTKFQLMSFLLIEIGTQGALASFFSFTLGTPLLYLWSKYMLTHMIGWYIYPAIPWAELILMFFLGILIALLAGLYPILRATKNEVRDVLQYE